MLGMSEGPLDGGWCVAVPGGDFLVKVVMPEVSSEEVSEGEGFRSTSSQAAAREQWGEPENIILWFFDPSARRGDVIPGSAVHQAIRQKAHNLNNIPKRAQESVRGPELASTKKALTERRTDRKINEEVREMRTELSIPGYVGRREDHKIRVSSDAVVHQTSLDGGRERLQIKRMARSVLG